MILQKIVLVSLSSFSLEPIKGERTKFWKVRWTGENSLANDFQDIFLLSCNKDITIAECWNEERNDWNSGLRRGLLDSAGMRNKMIWNLGLRRGLLDSARMRNKMKWI